jgi:cysteinyl-tRNA synthetase
MAADRSTAKQNRRSTDTRSRWTDATGRPTVSGRDMSPLELWPRGFAVTYVQNNHRRGRQDHPPGVELGIDAPELARVYERAYLDDMRALRNDSADVYARAGDYIDQVISQIERLQQAGATPSGRATRRATDRDRSSLGRFDLPCLSASASTRSRHWGGSRRGRMCT